MAIDVTAVRFVAAVNRQVAPASICTVPVMLATFACVTVPAISSVVGVAALPRVRKPTLVAPAAFTTPPPVMMFDSAAAPFSVSVLPARFSVSNCPRNANVPPYARLVPSVSIAPPLPPLIPSVPTLTEVLLSVVAPEPMTSAPAPSRIPPSTPLPTRNIVFPAVTRSVPTFVNAP